MLKKVAVGLFFFLMSIPLVHAGGQASCPLFPPFCQLALMEYIADPNVFYILIIIGFYALLYEFTMTGFGIPAVVGIVLLYLAYLSFQVLPVNALGLALIVGGIVLFLLEAFTAGSGLLAAAGAIVMLVGSLKLFHPMDPPVLVAYPLVFIFTTLTAFLTVFLVRSAIRSQRTKVQVGKEAMIGLKGEVTAAIHAGKSGKVSAQGTLWNAVSDEPIAKGESVEVVEVRGMELKVRKLKAQ